jgi:hypothetical protein
MASFVDDMKYWKYDEAPVAGLSALTPDGGGGRFPAIEVSASERLERGMPAVRGSGEKNSLPVSQLYELLDCPLRYWLKREAKLKERSISVFNEADAGLLTHKIWENVWGRARNECGAALRSIRALAAEELRKMASLEGHYAQFAGLLRDRRLARHIKNLEFYVTRLADAQQSIVERLAESGLRHEAVETEAEIAPYEVGGVTFTGRCDRTEILSGGLAVIVDYKLGRSASYEKKLENLGRRPYLDTEYQSFKYGLQLSAYSLMYGAAHPDVQVAGVGFLGHKDGGVAGSFEPPVAWCYMPGKKAASALKERAAEALEAMRCAAAILKSKRYEPFYSAESCGYCDVKGVCRKGELRGEALSAVEAPETEKDVEFSE